MLPTKTATLALVYLLRFFNNYTLCYLPSNFNKLLTDVRLSVVPSVGVTPLIL
jgi:hypothetical protein